MTRESGQRPEKLSLRKQLKLKCQEQSLNPVQNEVHLTYGGGADIRPIMTIVNYSQPMAWILISEFWFGKAGNRLCSNTNYISMCQMEDKVKEIVEIKQHNLAKENQKTLEVLKEREQLLQNQLQSAKESVSNMQKLHELAQMSFFIYINYFLGARVFLYPSCILNNLKLCL